MSSTDDRSGPHRRGRGRPSKGDAAASTVLHVRLTVREREALDSAAAAAGCSAAVRPRSRPDCGGAARAERVGGGGDPSGEDDQR